MRVPGLKTDRSTFNLLWKSLHTGEEALLRRVEEYGEDSDEGADALNNITALRLYRKDAERVFDTNAFLTDDYPFPAFL